MNSFAYPLRQSLPRVTNNQKSFVRHAASSRRHTKMLRLHPHPSMKLTADSPQIDHVIFNPPAASPTPLITPPIFLPKEDPRRQLYAGINPTPKASKVTTLPPPLRQPYQKTYHLTPADVEKIRSLRESDPVKWHTNALAKEFQCSTLFIGMVSSVSEERVREMEARVEKVKSKWGKKRTIAREDRQRRKAGWGGADGL